MLLEASVFMINSAHKTFYRSVYSDLTRRRNQLTCLLCFFIRHYDSSDIEFNVVMKI